ncbi:MAG: His/Gly/Thr/Pro-type tRNA ligase C-terminal domain-containing protein, partial [Bacteroidota bacterium]|nr:His/Gly/Thr/Pro-type tRNA ligase C-terminal domain-containing protein [Bacteroidota bacterium]
QLAVFPLVKKDGLPEIAQKIVGDLKWDFQVTYDEKDAVGRRYRRQDALGTPYCITIDHKTLKDQSVTIRDRDSMTQERIAIEALRGLFKDKLSIRKLLKKL